MSEAKLLQIGILIRFRLGVQSGREKRFLGEFLSRLILHDKLDDLDSHFVRMLDWVGVQLAVLDRLFAIELAIEEAPSSH